MRWIAYVLAAAAGVEIVRGAVTVARSPDPAGVAYFAVGVAIGLASVVLGVLIAVRRPRNPVGSLLVLVGLVPIWVVVGDATTDVATRVPELADIPPWQAAFDGGSWMLLYVPAALIALLFPDGRLPGPRWRWVVGALIAVPVLFDVLVAFDPTPYPPPYRHVPHPFPTPSEPYLTIITVGALALLPALLGLLFAAAGGMVVRYRRESDPVRRAQVKWFALGGLFLPATLLLCWASYLFTGNADLVLLSLAATFVAIPVATAIAVLRYDLYDVDRAISAAVTYGIVTVALLGFYTVAAFLVGLAAGRGSAIAAAAATAVCAAALAPLRVRLQRTVDRRLYPARRAALGAGEDLRRRTHEGTAQPEELAAVLRTALRDPALTVGYRLPGTDGLVDAEGTPLDPGTGRCIPVRLGGHEIGVLVQGGTGTKELLREIAAGCTLLIEVVRLRIEVGQALRDAESSRSRLLQVGYRERRRLERDLHDGAQQRLVSLGMAIRLAQRHLDDGTVDVNGLLDQSVAELGTAVAELRQIAHGLRPSSLDDGLAPALPALVTAVPVPVTLAVCPDQLPDDVATTAYYVVSEAVVNAVKHAEAGAIGLTVARLDGRLTVQVKDDGLGGARMRPGAGLAGLADRVAAAGGALSLSSPSGRGTVVEAVLPCAS